MAHRPHKPHNFRALSKPKRLHKSEHRHYLPYLPLLLLVVGTFFVSLAQPLRNHGVLAYATEVSANSLLEATNSQRVQNGANPLKLNDALSVAAQAKANDMIARNYWSHNTPDGKSPWVFIDGVGYKYQKAGENLAYGFLTSSGTVTGWMNSQSHKDNMLDNAFSEVGFGYANGENYNNNGNETVVVAMYGRPFALSATTDTPPPVAKQKSQPVTTASTLGAEPATKQITRIQNITNGQAPWALFGIGIFTGLTLMFLLIKHAAGLRHLIRDSERFVLHHPLLDTVLVTIVLVGSFLSQTTGFIR